MGELEQLMYFYCADQRHRASLDRKGVAPPTNVQAKVRLAGCVRLTVSE